MACSRKHGPLDGHCMECMDYSSNKNFMNTFPIHLAEEIIKSADMNNVQDAIVAVQLFSLELEQEINVHIEKMLDAHPSTAISVADITGLDTTNLQVSLEDLKDQIDQVDACAMMERVGDYVSFMPSADVNTRKLP